MGTPMFTCPGNFHFGIEPLDIVYFTAGRDSPEPMQWKEITFKCETAGDISRLSRKNPF